MRKYENLDIEAALNVVVEGNTEHYKSDFRHDIEIFKEAAKNPDGENNRFLWLSRRSGTECFFERNAYIRESYANAAWLYHADQKDEGFMAYAVEVTGLQDGRVMGNLHEINYKQHAAEVRKNALPCKLVTMVFNDGTEKQLTYPEYEKQRIRLCHQHGWIRELRLEPENDEDITATLKHAREKRDKRCTAAKFKARNPNQPSIRQQLADSRKQQQRSKAPTPSRANTLAALEV